MKFLSLTFIILLAALTFTDLSFAQSCKESPTSSVCQGSRAHCEVSPYASACEGTPAHCEASPYASACR